MIFGRLAVVLGLAASLVMWVPVAASASSDEGCDFNGDSFADLAVGVPRDKVNGDFDAGSVHVIYGTGSGLAAAGDQIWHRDRKGINDTTQLGDNFGWSVAAGDFDGSGYDDLAVGVPADEVNSDEWAGSVHVIYGTGSGLAAAGDQIWHRDRKGINDTTGAGDVFGWSVAV